MRTVLVLMDSLNRQFLSCYNPQTKAQTPCIDSFAKDCVRFDNHFIGSAPCIPARRDILTGRMHFLERCWGGIEPFDVTLPKVLSQHGVFNHLTTDHTHYFEIGGENYADQFDTWDYHRGQERDKWASQARSLPQPKHLGQWDTQYEANRLRFLSEEDYPTPKTFRSACRWIEDNAECDNFFLMVEAFDPHEPFDCPQHYLDLYPEDYDGPLFNWSPYGAVQETDEQLKHLQNAYCATLSMADHWFGKLMQTLQNNGLYEDTTILLTTDHGHMLGEHRLTGKSRMHCYNELARIPMLLKLPQQESAGEQVLALTQNIDIMPTVLKQHGIPSTNRVMGSSLLSTLEDSAPVRKAVIYGWHGQTVNVCDGKYTYLRAAVAGNQPCYNYCAIPTTLHRYWDEQYASQIECGRYLKHTEYPVYRISTTIPIGSAARNKLIDSSLLFNYIDDPQQLCSLQDSVTEELMCRKLVEQMILAQSPEEQFDRLGLTELRKQLH